MKFIARLRASVRSALHDLISEEADQPGASLTAQLDDLLSEAETHLVELRRESAEADARRKRTELSWQQVRVEAGELEESVDAALRAGQDELARTRLVQAWAVQARARDLEQLHQSCTQAADQLNAALAEQQARLEAARHKQLELTERDRTAAVLEELLRQRRAQNRRDADIAAGLRSLQEQVAGQEDRLAARADLDRDSGA